MSTQIVLVKHAQPRLDAAVPPRQWQLGAEGQAQARRLAQRLETFAPFILVSSREPKAQGTAEILGREHGVPIEIIDGLEEFDRPAMPLLSVEEREGINARIFDTPCEPVLGKESAAEALARFTAGLATAIERRQESETLVVITHGTVIALFVAAHNEIDAMELWKRLGCASFVVLEAAGFRLMAVVSPPAREVS